MRCPDCNKFVSYDEPQCEANSVEASGADVRASVTINLNCQDCGLTLKSTELEEEIPIDHTCKPEAEREKDWTPDPDYTAGDDDQFEVESEGEPEGDSRTQTTDRHGKPIKSARYMKTFYGFTLEPEIKCRACGEVFGVTLTGEQQASGFEEQT